MIPVKQTRLHIEAPDGTVIQKGNCFQAAVASLMELPLEEVPNFIEYSDSEWFQKFMDFLDSKGFEYKWHYPHECVPHSWSIGSGISPRARKDKKITHAVLCKNGQPKFDVHPDDTFLIGPITLYETITRKINKEIFLNMLPAIREVAKELGYSIGLHGSLARDFDLIACPWTEDAVSDWDLAQAIFKVTGCVRWRVLQNQGPSKPHGRLVYCMDWDCNNFENSNYIDLSIMPRITK